MIQPLPTTAPTHERVQKYMEVLAAIEATLEEETDWTAAMATVACELHNAFEAFHWTGFYRAVSDSLLIVGPYQGGHGCLRIDFSRGVCGAAARTRKIQHWDNVHDAPDHIACSSSTISEIVVPVIGPSGRLLAVLDVDSDLPAAFSSVDREALRDLCAWLGRRFEATA